MFYENSLYMKGEGYVMAYYNPNAAYDLELFDDDANGTSAPKIEKEPAVKKKVNKKKKQEKKVVKIPESDIYRSRRRKHNPLKLAVGTIAAAVVTIIIGTIIVGQVQLTELNQSIITAEAALEDAQSVYTQNQMKLEAKLSKSEIEAYAKDELGMTKAANSQKEFVALEGGDKAEVSVQKSDNIFTQFIEAIKSLWS